MPKLGVHPLHPRAARRIVRNGCQVGLPAGSVSLYTRSTTGGVRPGVARGARPLLAAELRRSAPPWPVYRYRSLAERGRFELPVPVKVRPLSRRVRSTTLPPLRTHDYTIRGSPGTDYKPDMNFRRSLPEIRCQACLSPFGQRHHTRGIGTNRCCSAAV